MKLFEAIEKYGKGDGVVLTLNEIRFTPYYRSGRYWYGKGELGQSIHWLNDCTDGWELYQEPVEMEDRWLWVDTDNPSPTMHNTMFYTDEEMVNYSSSVTKLEWSRTSFPKEKS